MIKGIDVYIDSGVHVKGFTELTDEAKEIAKQKLIDEMNQLKGVEKKQVIKHNSPK